MSIFSIYLILFVSSSYIGVAFMSWTQVTFLHYRPSDYLPGLPLIMIITTALIAIDAIIVYFYARPFDKLVTRIKNGGEPASQEEKQNALKTYRKMNTVTIISTIVGFIFGNGITVMIKVIKGVVPAEPKRLIFAMLQAIVFGAMASMYTVLVMNEKFAKYRKLLRIHEISNNQTSTISGTIRLLIVVYILYFSMNMMIVPYQVLYLQDLSPVTNAFSFYFSNSLIVFVLSVLTGIFPIHVILKGIRDRMKATADIVNDLGSKGDLSARIDISMIDDFGVLTSSINGLMEKLSQMIMGLRQGSDSVAESAKVLSDVSVSASSAIVQMSESFNRVNQEDEKQNQLILGVNQDINNLKESATSIEMSMTDQSSAMQENSAAINQMAANIRSVAEMAQKADVVSGALSQTSQEGNEIISRVVETILKIQESSQKVQEMVKLIQGIASQTNLLSMNAAIEAAHAGVYGAGFAVVADEVRSLATSSSKSAKAIQLQIKDMVEKITSGVEAITQAGSAFSQIASGVQENTNLIQTITNAMEEQRIGAEETMKVTTTVCETLEKINGLTKQQSNYVQNVKKAMETVIDSTQKVSESITEGKKAAQEINNTVSEVEKMAAENLSTVDSMKNQMSMFTV